MLLRNHKLSHGRKLTDSYNHWMLNNIFNLFAFSHISELALTNETLAQTIVRLAKLSQK